MRLASKCSVCTHEDRDSIDEQLARGRPLRDVGRSFGLSKDALHRHKRNHVDPQLAEIVEARIESGRMESLADQLGDARDAVQLILDSAMSAGQGALALAAVQQLRATIESLDRMLERERSQERAARPDADVQAIDDELERLVEELRGRADQEPEDALPAPSVSVEPSPSATDAPIEPVVDPGPDAEDPKPDAHIDRHSEPTWRLSEETSDHDSDDSTHVGWIVPDDESREPADPIAGHLCRGERRFVPWWVGATL
jgi:hypothetical protein